MNEHDATEIAFKNGYAKGKIDAVWEMAERLKAAAYKETRLYGQVQKVHIGVNVDTIDQIAKEMTEDT